MPGLGVVKSVVTIVAVARQFGAIHEFQGLCAHNVSVQLVGVPMKAWSFAATAAAIAAWPTNDGWIPSGA